MLERPVRHLSPPGDGRACVPLLSPPLRPRRTFERSTTRDPDRPPASFGCGWRPRRLHARRGQCRSQRRAWHRPGPTATSGQMTRDTSVTQPTPLRGRPTAAAPPPPLPPLPTPRPGAGASVPPPPAGVRPALRPPSPRRAAGRHSICGSDHHAGRGGDGVHGDRGRGGAAGAAPGRVVHR